MTLEEIFINKIEKRLLNFKMNPCSYQFRCPYCQTGLHHRSGRPWKNADFKAYFYQKKNATNFKCHKCGKHLQFHEFLKHHFPNEFIDYVRERELRGTTGYQHNCPTLANALIAVGAITCEKPDFTAKKNSPTSVAPKENSPHSPHKPSQSQTSCNPPKVIRYPMWTPQQQAGHQAHFNRAERIKRERDRQHRGELW